MPSFTSIKSGSSFQGRDAELIEMSDEIKKVKVGDRTVATASYWYNRKWLAKRFFADKAVGLDDEGLERLADEEGLPERCPASLWALKQVEKERRDIFLDSGLSFSSKMVDQVRDLADLDADSVPGAYQVPYLNGPTGSGKTMLVRIYSASVGKAYFPVLCTGDDELMLTKKLKGKKDLRASVRTEEIKKRAEFGVFETKEAQLEFLRELKRNGGGATLESHLDAFKSIDLDSWDRVAEFNGFPSDQSFSGIYVYGEAELAARIPMGVVTNFDEFGLATGAVQADIRELFFDRAEMTPGVNAVFTTTDNPAGEKYFNRTPIAGDNASRLQFRPIPLPSPDELVPDVCRSLGHKIDVEEANDRLLADIFCSTTPGLEERRPSILRDGASMDQEVIPPAKLVGGGRKTGAAGRGQDEEAVKFFKDILGDDGEKYFPEDNREKLLSKLLTREQAIGLSMRIVSLFNRVYRHVNEATGPLNPKFYNHDSANAPEFSRRTLRSICVGVENRMRDLLEEMKDGKVNVPEQMSLCVQKSIESYIFKQIDFRSAPSGTTIDGDNGRKAARESRPVISQIIKDSGLGWKDLTDLFAPEQGGWIETEAARAFGFSNPETKAPDGYDKVVATAEEMSKEIRPQDTVVRLKLGDNVVFLPMGDAGISPGVNSFDSKRLYTSLDPTSDGLSLEQLMQKLDKYEAGEMGGVNEQPVLDAISKVSGGYPSDNDLSNLADHIKNIQGGKPSEEVDVAVQWGGDIVKVSGGNGIYLIPLGGAKAVVLDYDPVAKKTSTGERVPVTKVSVLEGREQIAEFVAHRVIEGKSPGFEIPGVGGRNHVALAFMAPTAKPMTVRMSPDGKNIVAERGVGAAENVTVRRDVGKGVGGASLDGADEVARPAAPLPGVKPTAAVKPRKKQVYHKPDGR